MYGSASESKRNKSLKTNDRPWLTKDGERSGIEVGSGENGWWLPCVADDFRVIEGRDGV